MMELGGKNLGTKQFISLKALRPTIMPAVPRLLNRVFDKIQAEVAGSKVKSLLFKMALNSKENELKRGILRNNSFWDKLVFKKVQEGIFFKKTKKKQF